MTTEYKCDLCGDTADRANAIARKFKHKTSDRTARIEVGVSFRFVGHSTGFGGPPDLCRMCMRNLVANVVKGMTK